jgi:hypothetical protein
VDGTGASPSSAPAPPPPPPQPERIDFYQQLKTQSGPSSAAPSRQSPTLAPSSAQLPPTTAMIS